MKTKAALEVLLVNAQGITQTNLLGKPAYYVVIECGNHVYKSKISSGKDDLKACWNEKITLEFPIWEWKRLTHLKFRIMDKQLFSQTGFVGQTIFLTPSYIKIHLGGIITEGCDKGFLEIKPVPYNVVLEDDTYKGEIRIGLKFIADIPDVPNIAARRRTIDDENKNIVARSGIVKFWNILWWWSLFFPKKTMN